MCLRVHLPIRADARAWSTIRGRRHRFEEGVLYVYNNTFPHSADNESDAERLHLLADVWLSRETFESFFSGLCAPPPPFVALTPEERADLRARCAGTTS